MKATLIPFNRPDRGPVLTDEALVAACAANDPAALGELFDRHQRAVHRFVARSFRLSEADAEDVLQQTFVEVYRSAHSFRGGSAVSSWITGIAINTARRRLRSSSQQERLRLAIEEREGLEQRQSGTPEQLSQRQREMSLLREAINALPEHLRVVFVLCAIEGVAGVEAAKTLGLREGTLYRRLHQARKRLREALQEAV